MEPILTYTEPAAAPAATPHSVTPQVVEPSTQASVSQSEADTLAAWTKLDLAAGKISQQQADTIFAELETPATDRAPDTRSEDVKLLDTHFPPAKAEDFLLPFDDQEVPPEGKTSIRTWLGPEGVAADRTTGNTFVKTVDEIGRQLAAMPEAHRLDYPGKQLDLLKQQYGDSLDARFAQAKEVIGILEAKKPGLKALLQSGVGDSARVVSLIFDLSERWALRRKG